MQTHQKHIYFCLQICLGAIQRFITQDLLDEKGAKYITDVLWLLMESNIEEVKVLQTTALLLTINNLVRGEALAKVMETLLGPYYELRQSINFLFLLFKHVNFKHRNSNDVFIFKRSRVDEGTYVWKPSEDPFDHTAIKSERKIEGNFKETIRFKLYLIQPLTQLSGNGFFKPFTVLGSVLSTALRQRRNHWEHGRRHSPSAGLARFRARVK